MLTVASNRIEALDNKLSILNKRLVFWCDYENVYPESEIIKHQISTIKKGIEETQELLKEEIDQ